MLNAKSIRSKFRKAGFKVSVKNEIITLVNGDSEQFALMVTKILGGEMVPVKTPEPSPQPEKKVKAKKTPTLEPTPQTDPKVKPPVVVEKPAKIEKGQLFYIFQRNNPQLKKPYFKFCGQLRKVEAKEKEDCIYGSNYGTGYKTFEEYEAAIRLYESKFYNISKG